MAGHGVAARRRLSAGAASKYDLSVLVQKQGVIVVTLNYRLGAFGFWRTTTATPRSLRRARATTVSSISRRPCAGSSAISRPLAAIRVASRCSGSRRGASASATNSHRPSQRPFLRCDHPERRMHRPRSERSQTTRRAAGEQLAKDVGCDAATDIPPAYAQSRRIGSPAWCLIGSKRSGRTAGAP